MIKNAFASWLAVASIVVAGCSSEPSRAPSPAEVASPSDPAPPIAEVDPSVAPPSTSVMRHATKGSFAPAFAPATAPVPSPDCAGKKCGEPCPSMYGSPVPTACDAAGQCRPGTPVCDGPYDCDLSGILCDAMEPSCPAGMTPSRAGGCYGPCVAIGSCGCTPGKPTQCPEGYVCYAGTNRCGPYVN